MSTAEVDRVGERIREMRKSRSLTLVELAERCDLSHPFLSQLERGLARPSMASLERIARALGTSQVELLTPDDPRRAPSTPPSVVRADEGIVGPYAEGHARLLVDSGRPFRPMEFEGKNTEFGDAFVHAEDEWVYVITGMVEVELGSTRHTLTAGDSVYYPGGTAHRWRSLDGSPIRLVIVKEHPSHP